MLGLLFDHGCDCLNSVINASTTIHIMGYKGVYVYVVLLIVSMGFFMPNLEQLS